MFITKKALPRRTFLRGLGTCMALPLLDAMIPAGTALAQTAAKSPLRFGTIYIPHGVIMDVWMPKKTGTDFELPLILKPLEKHRGDMTVFSGSYLEQFLFFFAPRGGRPPPARARGVSQPAVHTRPPAVARARAARPASRRGRRAARTRPRGRPSIRGR